jgi:3-hydroxyisobutyrate dehydrogenase
MEKTSTLGVIGLGRMGGPLVKRLLKMSSRLMVWDTVEASRQVFEREGGVRIAELPEIARECEVIFCVVPSSKEIAQCLDGTDGGDGILAHARKGVTLVDLTTSDPSETRMLAARAAARGIDYLDAGMSGGPAGILAGTLTLMIGGDKEALSRVERHLTLFTENVFHLGASGSGHAMKLIHNMAVHTIFLATCESARMAERMGMRVEDMIEIFNVSTAFSYASRHRFPNNILNGTWDAQARVYNLWKDVGIAMELARECGADVELGQRTFGFLEKAVARGMVNDDLTLLYRDFDKIKNEA